MSFQDYIARDPRICSGKPTIAGTRVTVDTILASLTEGASIREVLEDFPSVSEEAVRAAVAFAAASAQSDPPPTAPASA